MTVILKLFISGLAMFGASLIVAYLLEDVQTWGAIVTYAVLGGSLAMWLLALFVWATDE